MQHDNHPNLFRFTQGGASLALGWCVTPRWGFCRIAAVDLVDGVDDVDGGFLNLTLLAFCCCTVNPKNLCALLGVLGVLAVKNSAQATTAPRP